MGNSLISLVSAWVLDPLHHGDGVARDFIVLFNAAQGKAVIYFCGDWDEGISRLYVLSFTWTLLPRLSVSMSFLVGSLTQVATSGVDSSIMKPPFLSWTMALIFRDGPLISCRPISAFCIGNYRGMGNPQGSGVRVLRGRGRGWPLVPLYPHAMTLDTPLYPCM